MSNLKKKIKNVIKNCWRAPLRFRMKRKLKNHAFSLISANCIGGVLTHDVCEQFRSPTINLIIPNFVEFCEALDDNLKAELVPSEPTSNGYPVCKCGKIDIVGVHYKSCEDLICSWNRRKERVNYNNVFLIADDNYIKNEELQEKYDKLPYPKICFTSKKENRYDWMIYLPEFEGRDSVGDSLRYANVFGQRIFEKHFDAVKWLNENRDQ